MRGSMLIALGRSLAGSGSGVVARRAATQRPAVFKAWGVRGMASESLEQAMAFKLEKELGDGTIAVVNDVSGGCGSAYDVMVYSPIFSEDGKKMTRVAQARTVHKVLSKEIESMHSINVKTFTDQAEFEKIF